MLLVEKAFKELYPDKEAVLSIEYSGRLKAYGGNVTYNLLQRKMHFKLSKKWMNIDEDIVIGLIQDLICKVKKNKKRTFNMDLYNNFVKNLHIAIPKDKVDFRLKESFDRVNERYFLGMVDMPNLAFSRNDATTTLGHYDFKTDTITISRIFEKRDDLVDFIMYHEMLHKVHKFKPGLKTRYHSTKFRIAEKSFENHTKMEKELNRFLRGRRIKKAFGF